jgi:hypothetical protein
VVDATNAAGLDLAVTGLSVAVAGQEPRLSPCTAFHGERIVASGVLANILPAIRAAYSADPTVRLLVFEDNTGRLVDVDLREEADRAGPSSSPQGGASGATAIAPEEMAARGADTPPQSAGADTPSQSAGADASPHSSGTARSPGRPRLGVVAREVTLLPRHWEWLNRQPGGASVALRKLVDEARKTHGGRDQVRQAQEVTYQFLLAIGGDLPGFEEALRALFAGRQAQFAELLSAWPADMRDHALRLAGPAFPTPHRPTAGE